MPRGDGMEPAPSLFAPTKFLPPGRNEGAVDRPVLLERLREAVDSHPLTLVSAPAGAGKTTILAQWEARQEGRMVAWVRAQLDDDDPRVLAAALVESLDVAAGQGSSRHLCQALANPASTIRHLAAGALRDLAGLERPVVVIDDAHALHDAGTLDLLGRILDGLPAEARIVLGSRSDPPLHLPRRRVRGEVAEFRLADLSLGVDEVRALLDQRGIDTSLTEELAAATGGWIAALVLWLRQAEFGQGRSPPEVGTHLRTYLSEEVLDQQPGAVRRFLLRCSVLDELTPDACAAVTEHHAFLDVVDELHRRNLFVARIGDTAPPVYRLHDLFLDFLRERLTAELPDEVAELHRRAALVVHPGEAIRHLVAAGDVDAAVDRVVGVVRTHLYSGQHHLARTWLALLPSGAADRHPFLQLVAGIVDMRSGRMGPARAVLERAVEGLQDAGDRAGVLLANQTRLEVALGTGDLGAAAQLRAWLEDQELERRDRAQLLVGDVWSSYYSCDWRSTEVWLDAAFDLVLHDTDPVSTSFVALGMAPELLVVSRGRRWYTDALRRLERSVGPEEPAMASIVGSLAAASFLDGDLAAASAQCDTAERISVLNGGVAWIDPWLAILRLALALASGDDDGVELLIEQYAANLDESPVYRQHAGAAAYALTRSMLRRSDTSVGAERIRNILDACAAARCPWADVDAAMVAGMMAQAHGDLAGARDAFERCAERHDAWRLFLLHGFPRLELARLSAEEGDEHATRNHARATLEWLAGLDAPGALLPDGDIYRRVLELFAGDGRLGPWVRRLLERYGTAPPSGAVRVPATGETLSTREVEVLRLVAAGLSNREIGKRLFIGERTVKSHMTAVLRKLGAANRTRAVHLARQLGVV